MVGLIASDGAGMEGHYVGGKWVIEVLAHIMYQLCTLFYASALVRILKQIPEYEHISLVRHSRILRNRKLHICLPRVLGVLGGGASSKSNLGGGTLGAK